jgi:hypothetical protein
VDREPFIVVDDHFFPERFEIAARTALVLDKEDATGLHGVEQVGRHDLRGILVEKGGDQVKGRVWFRIGHVDEGVGVLVMTGRIWR